jgi:hypothetical protein
MQHICCRQHNADSAAWHSGAVPRLLGTTTSAARVQRHFTKPATFKAGAVLGQLMVLWVALSKH